jgi:hypothetical protein
MSLPAAGLFKREIDGVAQAFEQANDGLPSFGEQGIVKAGNKQRHTHGRSLSS